MSDNETSTIDEALPPASAPATLSFRRSEPEGLRILYLCHRTPFPPNKGDKLRAFHQIRALSKRHRIDLLTLADQAEDMERTKPLLQWCERVEAFRIHRSAGYLRSALGALSRRPLSLAFFESGALARRVAELAAAEHYDVVLAYSSSMAPYAELVPDVPKVLDMGDVDSAKWVQYARFSSFPKRQIYALEARRLAAYEAEVSRRMARVVLVTSQETALLQKAVPEAPAVTVPNGVDFEFFRPLELPRAEVPTLVFTGQMDYFANVDGVTWFARQVFPGLRARFPDVEFLIVGRNPAPAVRALADLPGVTVTGTVGDVRPFLARSWVFVAPLRIAQGVQNKVLEAMASELPVACTGRVFAGLGDGGFRPDEDLVAADDPAALRDGIARLLGDADLRRATAERARRKLAAAFTWDHNLESMERVLTDAVHADRQVRPRPSRAEGVQSA
ncbi:MAG TPA: TIGR03087 family PEP-CTERM/XrtA system glycosyltransferase [Thermoanaerobaculia bacterium]|nr:TIGR03087 family PEP-CTERM/XrtA system glycosyltransferase [Thermoanaerobaculia bacterium]